MFVLSLLFAIVPLGECTPQSRKLQTDKAIEKTGLKEPKTPTKTVLPYREEVLGLPPKEPVPMKPSVQTREGSSGRLHEGNTRMHALVTSTLEAFCWVFEQELFTEEGVRASASSDEGKILIDALNSTRGVGCPDAEDMKSIISWIQKKGIQEALPDPGKLFFWFLELLSSFRPRFAVEVVYKPTKDGLSPAGKPLGIGVVDELAENRVNPADRFWSILSSDTLTPECLARTDNFPSGDAPGGSESVYLLKEERKNREIATIMEVDPKHKDYYFMKIARCAGDRYNAGVIERGGEIFTLAFILTLSPENYYSVTVYGEILCRRCTGGNGWKNLPKGYRPNTDGMDISLLVAYIRVKNPSAYPAAKRRLTPQISHQHDADFICHPVFPGWPCLPVTWPYLPEKFSEKKCCMSKKMCSYEMKRMESDILSCIRKQVIILNLQSLRKFAPSVSVSCATSVRLVDTNNNTALTRADTSIQLYIKNGLSDFREPGDRPELGDFVERLSKLRELIGELSSTDLPWLEASSDLQESKFFPGLPIPEAPHALSSLEPLIRFQLWLGGLIKNLSKLRELIDNRPALQRYVTDQLGSSPHWSKLAQVIERPSELTEFVYNSFKLREISDELAKHIEHQVEFVELVISQPESVGLIDDQHSLMEFTKRCVIFCDETEKLVVGRLRPGQEVLMFGLGQYLKSRNLDIYDLADIYNRLQMLGSKLVALSQNG